MKRKMLINASEHEEFRVAVVEDQKLEEFYIETTAKTQTKGNIYKGIISSIQPSLNAAFVNYGAAKNGFLQFSEIHPEYFIKEPSKSKLKIDDLIKNGQQVMVQVTKEESGNKGAMLTTFISIPGRYLVLMPGSETRGISRQIHDEKDRNRFLEILNSLNLSKDIGLIIRTVCEGQTKTAIKKDLNSLMRLWTMIRKDAQDKKAPCLLYKEVDLAYRAIRDFYTPDIDMILVDDKNVVDRLKSVMGIVSPRQKGMIKFHQEKRPLFARYQLEEQIEDIFRNSVKLSSGGQIVIDQTEALVAVDVNTGKFSHQKGHEETIFRTNMEAAVEIARQLRLRDLGGLIVIDFIDMINNKHIREVEKTIKTELRKDKAKTSVLRISKFGLLEMSRERIRPAITFATTLQCPYCHGTGVIKSKEVIAVSFLRRIRTGVCKGGVECVKGMLPMETADYLLNHKRSELQHLENEHNVKIFLHAEPGILSAEGTLEFIKKPVLGESAEEKTKDDIKPKSKSNKQSKPKAKTEKQTEKEKVAEGETGVKSEIEEQTKTEEQKDNP